MLPTEIDVITDGQVPPKSDQKTVPTLTLMDKFLTKVQFLDNVAQYLINSYSFLTSDVVATTLFSDASFWISVLQFPFSDIHVHIGKIFTH